MTHSQKFNYSVNNNCNSQATFIRNFIYIYHRVNDEKCVFGYLQGIFSAVYIDEWILLVYNIICNLYGKLDWKSTDPFTKQSKYIFKNRWRKYIDQILFKFGTYYSIVKWPIYLLFWFSWNSCRILFHILCFTYVFYYYFHIEVPFGASGSWWLT